MIFHGKALLLLPRQREGPLPPCLSYTCKIQSAFSDSGSNGFVRAKHVHLILVVFMTSPEACAALEFPCRPELCGSLDCRCDEGT